MSNIDVIFTVVISVTTFLMTHEFIKNKKK